MRFDDLEQALRPLVEAMGAQIVPAADVAPGDIEVQLDGATVFVRPPHLDEALARLIEGVERELGAPLDALTREQKQRAVGLLHDRGAFNLRKSVEDVAAALGVSRFTVYNYLDRIDEG